MSVPGSKLTWRHTRTQRGLKRQRQRQARKEADRERGRQGERAHLVARGALYRGCIFALHDEARDLRSVRQLRVLLEALPCQRRAKQPCLLRVQHAVIVLVKLARHRHVEARDDAVAVYVKRWVWLNFLPAGVPQVVGGGVARAVAAAHAAGAVRPERVRARRRSAQQVDGDL